jgi:RNA polymerase sigma-70 factor (ECF subfamily)
VTSDYQPDDLIETAYATHAGPLLRRLTASTHDVAAAEDLTQEAFMRLVIEVQAGRVPDHIGAWLNRVAQNLAASRGRRITVATRRSGELLTDETSDSPERLAIDAEQDGSLRSALSELALADRQVLVLAAHGYRGPEIARSIGRTDAATRTLLCRARTKLRFRLIQAGAS